MENLLRLAPSSSIAHTTQHSMPRIPHLRASRVTVVVCNQEIPVMSKKTVMLPSNFVPGDDQASNLSNLWHVFPLHYGDDLEPSRASFPNPQLVDSDKIGPQQSSPALTLDARCPSNHEEIEQQVDCDLTLRLGSLVAPHARIENSCPLRVQYGNRSIVDRIKSKTRRLKD